MNRRLTIFDTTLREGEQAPGCAMLPHDKVAIAELLEKLNVDVIEAGFAASSRGDFLAVQSVAAAVQRPTVSSLCRAVRSDIDAAAEALKKARRARIHVVLGTSNIHLEHKLGMSRAQALDCAVEAVRYARKFCHDVQFTAEDAGRTERVYLLKVVEAVAAAGAMTVNLSDTVGYLMPDEMAELISAVREDQRVLGTACLSVHVHDDLGLSLASTLSAIQAGVGQVECTVNGIGDRAGICALEEVVSALKIRRDYFFGVHTDINEEFLVPASRLVAQATGTKVPHFKSIVGARARRSRI